MLETVGVSDKAKVQGEGEGKPKKSSLGPWTNVSVEHLEKTAASLERYEFRKKVAEAAKKKKKK